jgi:hypothetical protein
MHGASKKDAIDALFEAGEDLGYSPDLWRLVLQTLSKKVKSGQEWIPALTGTVREWTGYGVGGLKGAPYGPKRKAPKPLTTSDVVKFLIKHSALSKAKAGMSDDDITRIYSRLAGSEEELDAYLGAKKPYTPGTERLRIPPKSVSKKPKSRRRKKKDK